MIRRVSFQAKLLLAFVLIVALVLVLSHVFIDRYLDRAFHTYIVRNVHAQDERTARELAADYQHFGGWTQVIERIRREGQPVPFILADLDGTVLVARDPELQGRRLTEDELAAGIPIEVEGQTIATLLPIVPPPLPPSAVPSGTPEHRFLSSVNSALWKAGLAVGGVALLLGLVLLRQLTVPLRDLATATGQVTKGRYDERVPIRSSDELGHLARSFNEMAAHLEKAEQTKRDMIADVAHELRTPISVVQSGLEGILDDVLEPSPENIAALHTKILLVSRLMQDLQQLALADAGQLSIHLQQADLPHLLAQVITTIDPQMEEQEIHLDVELPDDLPLARADPQRIEQVFLNLLSNAMRHSPAGGKIHILASLTSDHTIQVSVCDSGPGLREEDLEHVFERFYRADRSRTRASGGSGLGLAVAKALIEAHGGRIWAENAPEGGACFYFTLSCTQHVRG